MRSRDDRQPRRLTRRATLSALGLGTAAVSLAACTGSQRSTGSTAGGSGSGTATTTDFSARFAAFKPADAPNGDLTKVVWPPFILQAGPDVQALYEFQITNGELMRYMPCFCGCQREDNHRNNRDCYIDRVNPDGSVLFDSMAPT